MGWYGPSVDVSVCYFVALPRLEHSVGVGMLTYRPNPAGGHATGHTTFSCVFSLTLKHNPGQGCSYVHNRAAFSLNTQIHCICNGINL